MDVYVIRSTLLTPVKPAFCAFPSESSFPKAFLRASPKIFKLVEVERILLVFDNDDDDEEEGGRVNASVEDE